MCQPPESVPESPSGPPSNVRVWYRIYEIREGLLKEPQQSGYGGPYGRFEDHPTEAACWQELANDSDAYGVYVVLPMMSRRML